MQFGLLGITGTNEGQKNGELLIEMESVHLNPSVGKVPEMVQPVSTTSHPSYSIRLTKDRPILKIKNAKIIFINRVIAELQHFQKEIKLKIKKLKESMGDLNESLELVKHFENLNILKMMII
mgnify:CR=1 FL=1